MTTPIYTRMKKFSRLYHQTAISDSFPITLNHSSKRESYMLFTKRIYLKSNNFLSNVAIPIYVKHNIQFREGSNGRFEVTIGPRAGLGKIVTIALIK